MRRFKTVLAASPLLFFGLGGSVGQQDIFALINAQQEQSPRWMMALEPANFTSRIAPKLELGTPPVPDYTNTPVVTLTSAEKGFKAKPLYDLEEVVVSVRPTEIPETIETNQGSKGDRKITVAPDRQMVDMYCAGLLLMIDAQSAVALHEALSSNGCHYGQGFLYARAVSADEAADLLRSQADGQLPFSEHTNVA